MGLHHRAVIRAFNKGDILVRKIVDIGFEWGTDWRNDVRVVSEVQRLEAVYDVVKVDMRDAG